MRTVIRKADTSDLAVQLGIKELDKECLPADYACEPDKGAWWVAWKGKQPVAYAGIMPSRQWGGTAYLCRAGVLPAHRGSGLQKRLIRVRLKYAKENKYKWVISDTSKENVASSNSLISCGFKLYRPRYSWSYESALYWRKEL